MAEGQSAQQDSQWLEGEGMFSLKGYLYATAALAVLSLFAYAYALQASNARKAAEIARLGNELRVMEEVAARNALARDVARAESERFAREAASYEALNEDILRGNGDETPVDPSTIAVIERLRRGGAN